MEDFMILSSKPIGNLKTPKIISEITLRIGNKLDKCECFVVPCLYLCYMKTIYVINKGVNLWKDGFNIVYQHIYSYPQEILFGGRAS